LYHSSFFSHNQNRKFFNSVQIGHSISERSSDVCIAISIEVFLHSLIRKYFHIASSELILVQINLQSSLALVNSNLYRWISPPESAYLLRRKSFIYFSDFNSCIFKLLEISSFNDSFFTFCGRFERSDYWWFDRGKSLNFDEGVLWKI
jgi:hypothetical protein